MSERPHAYLAHVDATDTAQLEALVATIEEGFNRKDATILDGRFTADAVLVVPDGTVLRGWTELFAYHGARLDGPVRDWTTRLSVTGIGRPGPEVAVVHVRQETTTPDRSFANHGTIVAVKRDGAWWIAAMQNTNVQTR